MDHKAHITPSDHEGRPIDVGELLWSSADTKWAGFQFVVHRLHERVVAREAVQVSPMVSLCIGGTAQMQAETGRTERRDISSEGALVLSGRGLEYDSFSWTGSTEVVTVGMDMTRIAGATESDRFSPEFMPMHRFLIRDAQISALLQNMLAEARAGCPAGSLYGESLSIALASYVAGRYATSGAGAGAKPTLSRGQLRLVRDYVHAHLAEDITLFDLAQLSGHSVSHFSKLFKNTCAYSPHKFVIRERVAEALRLLSAGGISITEIAQQTGFADQSHLTRVIKKATDMTPKRYQEIRRGVAGCRL